jgi:hypothetical protein
MGVSAHRATSGLAVEGVEACAWRGRTARRTGISGAGEREAEDTAEHEDLAMAADSIGGERE